MATETEKHGMAQIVCQHNLCENYQARSGSQASTASSNSGKEVTSFIGPL